MKTLEQFKGMEIFRYLEIACIFIFILASILLLIVVPSAPAVVAELGDETTQIEAYASAMPNQGWTPLTVYFSAFSSYSTSGKIIKIE